MLSRLHGALFAALLIALPLVAVPQEPADKLIARYTDLAGSSSNAEALVTGLRNDTTIKLTSGSTSTSFTAPTGKMGYGNVDNALALAEASLKAQGISDPTPEQLKAALVGGTINGKTVEGVLAMRASGQGWGQIANSRGFKLGDVKRAERPERPARPERPERPERPQKGR